MPLQIAKINNIIRCGLALALILAAIAVIADGGRYSQTMHGSTTQGVNRDATLPVGSCNQCHTAHSQNPQDFGLWTVNDNTLCFTCHLNTSASYFGQTTYALSGHSTSTASFNNRSVGKCVQCHNPHGAGDSQGTYTHLTAFKEEAVCYLCHGTGTRPQGAQDVQTPSTRLYAHSVANFQWLHDDNAEFNSVGNNPNPKLSGSSRHVECADCHNTHYARTSPRAARSSNIGETLLGSWGVKPLFSGIAWSAPTSYVVERFLSTTNEYESYLCLKCHSNWSWGNAAPKTADGNFQSNIAIEVNPSNPSYHNLTGQSSISVPTEDYKYNTSSPLGYINGWDANSAMACSDCHASDSGSGIARGSHGSNFSFMLKKRFKAVAQAIDNTGRQGTQSDLCFDCHDYNTYGEGGNGSATNFRNYSNNLHTKSDHARAGCFQCHSAVPHGFKRKHMIVYVTDGAPYYQSDPINYSLKRGGIQAFAHATNGTYTDQSCKAGCHYAHQRANPSNPLP